jgi:hypothetical protein
MNVRSVFVLVIMLGLVGCRTDGEPPPVSVPAEPGPEADVKPEPKGNVEKNVPDPVEPETTDFTEFGRALARALDEGAGEEFCFTAEEINQLHIESTASILQVGRVAWLRTLSGRMSDAKVRFVEIRRGPDFTQTLTTPGPPGHYRLRVPQVTDLQVELTIDGDPRALVIRRMYYVNSRWKIFDAVLGN